MIIYIKGSQTILVYSLHVIPFYIYNKLKFVIDYRKSFNGRLITCRED